MLKQFKVNNFFSIYFENNKNFFYLIPTTVICNNMNFHIDFKFGTICVRFLFGKCVHMTSEEIIDKLKDILNKS